MNRRELIEQLLNGDMDDMVFCTEINEEGKNFFFEIERIACYGDSRKHGSCSYYPTILIHKTTD